MKLRRKHLLHLVWIVTLAFLIGLIGGVFAGRQGAPRPTLQSVKAATGHSCATADFAMQCRLPAQPLPPIVADRVSRDLTGRAASVVGLYGVDFAWGGPRSCSQMRALGARFAIGYLSNDPGKNLGQTAAQLRACGIPSVVGWETTATRALQGYAAGVSDAIAARAQAANLGNTGRPVWFAIDFDATGPDVLPYFQGVHSVLGARAGAYGGYRPLLFLHSQGVIGAHNFQSYAWSGGLWLPASIAPLEQYLNGNTYDNDRAIAPDYGQFPYTPPSTKPRPRRDPYRILSNTTFRFGRARANERRTALQWDRARCRNPVRRPVCRSTRYHLLLLRDRDYYVAHHRVVRGRWVATQHPRWGEDHLGGRYQALSRRLNTR